MRNKRDFGNTVYYEGKTPGTVLCLISKIKLSVESQTMLGCMRPIKEMAMSAGFDVSDMP